MNKKELGYFTEQLFINHVNNEEDLAIKLNKQILLALFHLDIISEELFNKTIELIKGNKFSDIITAEELLAEKFNIPIKH